VISLKLREKVITGRTDWISKMLAGVRSLPLESYEAFTENPTNIAAAESYLRRALEALLDLGRHTLAKGFGKAVPEYKLISTELEKVEVLTAEAATTLRILAGYRNRMVHFYHEISSKEIYEICVNEIGDVEKILHDILSWINKHPEMLDRAL
jgi:uncharacterized protein YutE (UPF0331/DUF86 family)